MLLLRTETEVGVDGKGYNDEIVLKYSKDHWGFQRPDNLELYRRCRILDHID